MKQVLFFAVWAFVMCGAVSGTDRRSRTENVRTQLRKPRQISGYKIFRPPKSDTYNFCKYQGTTGACLKNFECNAERGRFMGYCGSSPEDGDCCYVSKTCGGFSSSHAVRFQNPNYPEKETEGMACMFNLRIRKGICAVRMDNEVFEFKKFAKDYCPQDTFTILGTKSITAPICGNMTGWATTFEVDELSELTFAVTGQGDPPYRFSTLLTMMPCKDVITLRAPLNAGMKNVDAEEYVPTTTTEEPDVTTTDPSTEDSITETEAETETVTITVTEEVPQTTTPFQPTQRDAGKESGPTPLPVGIIKIKPPRESVIAKTVSANDEFGYANEFFDPTPNSVLKKIYDEKVGDTCRVYDELEDVKTFGVPHPENINRISEDEKCWFYDPITGSYRVNEDCVSDSEDEQEDGGGGGFRIIGGKQTNINEYPWQVALIYKSKFFCGGALISNTHVLTASHCIFGSFSEGIHRLQVSLGDHDLRTKSEAKNLLVGVRRIIWNAHYNSYTTANDIGILELMEPVEYSYEILPIGLPSDLNADYSKHNATITGWGRNSLKTKKTSSILKEYTAPIDDIDNCVKRWKAFPAIDAIKNIHLCLNVTYGTPCHGDSGGPLVVCNNGPRCTLIGIVSFGFPLCRNVGLPAVFSRVTAFRNWIDINTSPILYHYV